MSCVHVVLLLVATARVYALAVGDDELSLYFTMPEVSPKFETHLLFAHKLDPDQPMYITGVIPRLLYAKHILLYACRKPFSAGKIWEGNSVCKDAVIDIHTISRDSSRLHYPDGVGLKVGGDSGFLYLVMQVHYQIVEPFWNGAVDTSGLILQYTTTAPVHLAGQLMLLSRGYIEPGKEEHFEAAVVIDEDVVIHPFWYMVHTHELGKVVAGYRVRGNQWTEIGRRSPQLSHVHAPAKPVTITKGDVVATRCTMFNFKNHTVHIGETSLDEMCSYRMMYYVDDERIFSKSETISLGPPGYYWSLDERIDTSNVPLTASEIPPPPDGPAADQLEEHTHKGMRDVRSGGGVEKALSEASE